MTVNVGCIVGSLSAHSINRRLAEELFALAPPGLRFQEIAIKGLTLYNDADDTDLTPAVRTFKAEIEAADALLFVTPEYNRSIPGALKNALDVGSRPWGANSWSGKRCAVIGTGLNGAGTAVAQSQLRGILGYLGLTVMGTPEICLPWTDRVLDADVTRGFLTAFLTSLSAHLASVSVDGQPAALSDIGP